MFFVFFFLQTTNTINCWTTSTVGWFVAGTSVRSGKGNDKTVGNTTTSSFSCGLVEILDWQTDNNRLVSRIVRKLVWVVIILYKLRLDFKKNTTFLSIIYIFLFLPLPLSSPSSSFPDVILFSLFFFQLFCFFKK